MQLASRCLRLGTASTRSESRKAGTVKKGAIRRAGTNARIARAKYWTSAVVRSDKHVAPHYDTTPTTADAFKHLEVPEDIMKEAVAFKKEVEAMDASQERLDFADSLQALTAQVGLLQKAADYLRKDIRDVTALDAAVFRLHEQDQFVSGVELDKVVLFSHKATLDSFIVGRKTIASRYPNGEIPADINIQLDSIQRVLTARADNEEIITVPVSEDLYQHVQANLFPSLAQKGVTAQDLLDWVGGDDGLIDPVTFHVRDLLMQLQKAPENEKTGLLAKLEQSIVAFETGLDAEPMTDADKARLYGIAIAQTAAEETIGLKLGRRVVIGDIMPERRLERSLDVYHPMLAVDQTYYVHGDVKNVREATLQMLNEQAPTIEFEKRDDFNPATGYRHLTREALKLEPETAAVARKAALDFAYFEGAEVGNAINGAELIAEMKLYKLFHYQYPMIGDSAPAQRAFMEMYDISPGEPTLEWALGWPTKEHTFFPEHALWVQVFEDDEEVEPIVWPDYTPVTVEGFAEIASQQDSTSATISFLPHTPEFIASEAHYNHAFSSLPIEKRFNTPREQVYAAAKALSEAEKQKAEKAWAALTPSQKQSSRTSWAFEASPLYTASQFTADQQAISNLQQKVISPKL